MIYIIRTKTIVELELNNNTNSKSLINSVFTTKNFDEAINKAKEIVTLRKLEEAEKIKSKKYNIKYIREDITITNSSKRMISQNSLENFLAFCEKLPF